MKTFPSPEALRRFPFGLADIAVILGTLVLLALIARLGAGALVSFEPHDIVPAIDLDPRNLPYYAGRSTLRMFIALVFSTLFTLAYGYIAANSRRAEQVMIPLLGINNPDCNRVGNLHRCGNYRRGLASDYLGNWHDEFICCRDELGTVAEII